MGPPLNGPIWWTKVYPQSLATFQMAGRGEGPAQPTSWTKQSEADDTWIRQQESNWNYQITPLASL